MAELRALRRMPASAGAPAQLVVLCHGVGAGGHDLIGIADAWAEALPGAAFVAPDAPEPYDAAPAGRQWFSLRDRTLSVLERGADRAAASLNPFVDAELARLGLAPDACALMGFSQGAMTVLHAGLRRAGPPRALLAYSGALLAPHRLEGLGQVPVLLVHGEADEVVPVSRSRDAERALRAAGRAVKALYLPGLGHAIDEIGLAAGAAFLRRAFGLPPATQG